MNCADFRDLLNPFLDSELEVEQNVACLKHVELCPTCAERVSQERHLHERIVSVGREPLAAAARVGLLGEVFARVEAEDAVRGGRLPRWPLALAAALLLSLGGVWFVRSDPLCWWGCSTHALLLQAQSRLQEEPQSLAEIEQLIHRSVDCPPLVGSEVRGCQTLLSEGCPCHPLVRYSLPNNDEICYVALPGGHQHVGKERQLPDGRRYVVGRSPELRFVGWKRDDGTLAVCMPTCNMPDEKLFVLAAALRGP